MPTRRNFLRWSAAAAALAAIPVTELATRATATAATTLPLTVVNDTGRFASTAIWFYIVGVNPSGQQVVVRSDGTPVVVTPSLNGADGFADLSIPLGTTVNLPQMSGRIYFSVNDKLKFKVVGANALQYPAGWVTTDPSFAVLHDWVEFTLNPSGMFCNTTMVDMFGIPLSIHLSGAAQQTTGTLVAGGREAIMSGIAAQPGFGQLVLANGTRVIAPGHGIDAGLFSSTYYDAYVNQVWSQYAGTDLNVSVNGTTLAGRVSGTNLVFAGGGGTFAKPRTQDIFYCAGALAPPAGTAGPVAAVLGAAFNRSTLLTSAQQPVNTAASFYQNATTNHYSRIIHQNMADGKAYGFPFDDVSGFAAFVSDGAPTSITVTLTPF
ncbi:MAG TPA: beta-1,3-glucanase family protein [Pseudonocardiaceae bacterium]|nr:beta-1,3-glucanase family protein [Pseudonocardiaceae bacterium]